MKRIFTSIGVTMIGISGIAQPVISSGNDLPTQGTSYLVKGGKTSIVANNAGANQTWDFSAASLNDIGVISIIAPASAADATSFQSANYARKLQFSSSSLISYDFYVNSSTKLELLGNSSNQTSPTVFGTPEVILKYPFNYGDSTTNTFTVGASSFTETLHYDGYGTLKIGEETFNNVIRISSRTNGLPPSYYWYTTSPLLNVLSFTRYDSSLLYYSSFSTGIGDVFSSREVSIYPNPAKDQVQIRIKENARLSMTDVQGRTVGEWYLKEGETTLSLRNFSKGIYFYILEYVGSANSKGKFCLE